ncbi:S1C family serine protease [Virgibacillus halodenitrificans]|uniref:S1C family serine protease n=1 Tax=Virgibacillus halodenitrificans TaxID=1482 RepID=UPI000EF4FC75|nr:trypsin-like peptidase domain-containing protein [Virgibacillus halodenitrificans]MCG1029825.1 trypsin-like peptidase domain-containing protein [Virgibacillus halodenitrificans]MEC2159086.1 trypsin-like peptidase domain-containing protein [Virgibacillus halodenitrificans]
MKKIDLKPVILSALLLFTAFIIAFSLYQKWSGTELTINNPAITKVTTESKQLDLKTIIHEAEKSVIQIEGQNDFNTITGSGFLFNDKGDIITNAHVIRDADVLYVRTANAQIYPAAVVGVGEEKDVAVIRVPQLADQNLNVEENSTVEIGDEVIALGSPHGFQNTVTLGIISGTDRNFSVDGFDYENVYQISAQITHGNSGGPLIDRETGKVIGINSVGTEDGLIGFSIPMNEVLSDIKKWSNEMQNTQLDFTTTADIIRSQNDEQFIQDAEYLIEYFLDSVNIRDYINAYSLLGSNLQTENTYAEFREAYINIVNLSYSELESKPTENDQISTSTTLKIERKNQKKDTKKELKSLKLNFLVGYENDQLKIVDLKKTEL